MTLSSVALTEIGQISYMGSALGTFVKHGVHVHHFRKRKREAIKPHPATQVKRSSVAPARRLPTHVPFCEGSHMENYLRHDSIT